MDDMFYLSYTPPAVRPSFAKMIFKKMDDDLTAKLCDIIKCNNAKQKIESNSRSEVINDWTKVFNIIYQQWLIMSSR